MVIHADTPGLESRLDIIKFVSATLAVLTPLQDPLAKGLNRQPFPTAVLVGVALVGAVLAVTVQGLQLVAARKAKRRAQELAARMLLARPELPTAGSLTAEEYGAHAPAREYAALGYVPRDIDPAVEAALRRSRFVLVVGPRLSGKTRTAAEAVRRVRPAARAVLPRSPEALQKLLDPTVRLPWEKEATAVLWLEDLGPYLDEGFDAAALEQVATSSVPVTVVATMSTPDEARARTAPPPDGARNRALLARAERIEVAAELSAAERSRFAELAGRPPAAAAIGQLIASDAALLVPGSRVVAPPAPPAVPAAPVGPPPSAVVTPTAPAASEPMTAPVIAPSRVDDPARPAAIPSPRVAPPPPGGRLPWSLPAGRPPRPPKAGRGGGAWLGVGVVLALCGLVMGLTTIPAIVCGVVVLARRRIAAGLAVITLALVCGAVGLAAYSSLAPFTRDATDDAALNQYFSNRLQQCQAGLTPEFPNCGIVLDRAAQEQWLAQFGYDACRKDGDAAADCITRMP